jgi:hypothetical protein
VNHARARSRVPASMLALLLLLASPELFAQARIIEWVESAPTTDSSRIALGYPVPIPVDTPLPFDGFRSYAGLLTRHQDLDASSAFIQGEVVGLSRAGREVRAYLLGDGNNFTRDGQPEAAMLTNGGIHAREWQTPEIVTGIMELLHEQQDDGYLFRFLRDNVNAIVIPVLNVDGFMQTQRFPAHSWLGTDINSPESSPRDGRMRRKNMLGVDENLQTSADHLLGVDLNRNNAPYWSTAAAGGNSSADNRSIVHHGQSVASEPEIQALQSAAQLGPVEQLALFTDVHSFGQVSLWVRNDNDRLANLTAKVLQTFRGHHAGFPAQKFYNFSSATQVARNQGIGTTDEYFTHVHQVPAWTLEVEPCNNGGADYGGLARNGHDGFILPESQIRRVRTQLAETFAVAYYRQAGPPHVVAVRLSDAITGAVVLDAEWDYSSEGERVLHVFSPEALRLDRDYRAWIAFSKPMRWRVDGQPAGLPGAIGGSPVAAVNLQVNGANLTVNKSNERWLGDPGDSPSGFHRYAFDTWAFDFRLPADGANQAAVNGVVNGVLDINAFDMTTQRIDSNPATVAHWQDGGWSGYEDSAGTDLNDTGGNDKTIPLAFRPAAASDPFTVEAGTSSIWVDPERHGEGFMLEILANQQALVYWFTYNDLGEQDWYYAVGEIRGNRVLFNELLQVENGHYGPGFDPAAVENIVVGSASFTWTSCAQGVMDWRLDDAAEGASYRHGRMNLTRVTYVMGLGCDSPQGPPVLPEVRLSGTWADPTRASEGYSLEVLNDGRVLVYWFSFGPQSERRWFYNVGEIQGNKLVFDNLLTTHGPIFGDKNPLQSLVQTPWGKTELQLNCLTGTATYSSTEAGFAPGTMNLKRVTVLDGLDCP